MLITNWIQGFRNVHKASEIELRHQMAIFSHIEHISHKWPIKVKFSLRWPYFHTLSIFHTNIQWKLIFHTNGHIFTHLAYFTQMTNKSQIFTQMTIFSYIEHILHNHFATFHCGLGFWNSWLFYCGHCTSMKLRWLMVFLAWSSSWWKEESYQIDQTLPHWRHSRL
jgi:hypothetical protein